MPTYAQPAWPNRAAVLAGLAAALIGVLALIGWYADLPLLTTGLPGHPPMIPNTALALVAAGVAVAGMRGRWRPVSYGLAMLVVALGGADAGRVDPGRAAGDRHRTPPRSRR